MIEILNSSLSKIKQEDEIDLFLTAIGFENRASHLAKILSDIKVKNKICFELVQNPNPKEKDELEKLGFKFINKSEINNILSKDFKIMIIDYSVMMKSLYGEIIEFFYNQGDLIIGKVVYFSYSHGIFEPPNENQLYVDSIKPILLTETKEIRNNSKIKLILSLGYERLSAVGLIENLQIDYKNVIVLINKEKMDSLHYLKCLEVNSDFLSMVDKNQIFEINFFDYLQISSTIESIFFNLSRNNDMTIIAPMSVKTFSLYSMVLSLKYDNTRFYNVTSKNNSALAKKYANTEKDPVVYQISYSDDSVPNDKL